MEAAQPPHEYRYEECARNVNADEPDQGDIDHRWQENLQDAAELLAVDERPAALRASPQG